MKLILVDDQEHSETIDNLSPEDTIVIADRFIPCGNCGAAVLPAYMEVDCCSRCAREDDEIRREHFQREKEKRTETEVKLMAEWEAGCDTNDIDLKMFPNPSFWHDVREELEYARASITSETSDKVIAENVRCSQWLTEIGNRWETMKTQQAQEDEPDITW